VVVRAHAEDRLAAVPALFPDAHLGRGLHPGRGPGDRRAEPQELLGLFFIGVCTRRHVRFMAKTELIQARYGRLLVRLGAFPVRRGEADEDALETARIILRQGGLLALFPEGTRIRDPDNLAHPRRGAGRLALETGAPLVPCAITGTEKIFRGGVPRRVQVAFSPPIDVADLAPTPEAASELIEGTVWPEVEGEYRRLGARPTLIAASLAALGLGAGCSPGAGGAASAGERRR
jgi:1-acyl-sn-glycerol-3-phosphate acyltransferase